MKPTGKYLAPLVLTLASLACSLSGGAAPQATPQMQLPPTAIVLPTTAPAATVAPLTAAMLQNMEYTLPASQKTVKLTDGKYEAGSGADYLSVGMAEPIGFGDLNGDGLADAAVVLGENTGGSGVFESLVVVLNQAGAPKQGPSVQIGDRVQVKTISIQAGQITLDEIVPGPQDPMCCPTQPVTETFRLTMGGLFLDRLVSKAADGTERAIRIDAPAGGDQVGDSLHVTGTETIAPFENNLVYRIYDSKNNLLGEGTLTTQASAAGSPAAFDTTLDLSKIASGTQVWLEIMDISAPDGSTLALTTLALKKG
jgi:hypothetical protein